MIHKVLNIFDPTRFATHMSYFFLMIAVIVVANSGKLVHAAMTVAQIAHCDIHRKSAINTAASTITSEAITKSQILAISLVIFNSIPFDVSFAQGMLLLKAIITNIKNSRATNIPLILSIHNSSLKPSFVFIFTKASSATHKKRYIKFLIFGTETSIASSVGDSFFMIR